MFVKTILTHPPTTAGPGATILHVAQLMRDENAGAVLIMQGDQLVGIVTDRDITTSLQTADLHIFSRPVSDIMSGDPLTCRAESDVVQAARIMADYQVRRLPVTDRNGQVIGLLTLDDIAEHCSEQLAGETLGEIVELRCNRLVPPH